MIWDFFFIRMKKNSIDFCFVFSIQVSSVFDDNGDRFFFTIRLSDHTQWILIDNFFRFLKKFWYFICVRPTYFAYTNFAQFLVNKKTTTVHHPELILYFFSQKKNLFVWIREKTNEIQNPIDMNDRYLVVLLQLRAIHSFNQFNFICMTRKFTKKKESIFLHLNL